jgi:hypothetical protein
MKQLVKLPEPALLFGYNQWMEDPRDGLTLFGPLEQDRPYGIRYGVIGTRTGIKLLEEWIEWAQGPVAIEGRTLARPPFPGFEAAFRIPWKSRPSICHELSEDEIGKYLYLDDGRQRVYGTVGVFADPIIQACKTEESKADVWFVVIPDDVRSYCRPHSVVDAEVRQRALRQFSSTAAAKAFYKTRSLFPAFEEETTPYLYEEHFRDQLKARLLASMVPTQVIRESTLANTQLLGVDRKNESEVRLQSAIAWTLSTAAFYKAGGRPWKLARVREAVCYVGLVFKKDGTSGDRRMACCAAQMFLDSGDGVVFKGAVGPWYSPENGEFHLRKEAAKELGDLAVESYRSRVGDEPKEMFIHGRVRLDSDEWSGFEEAVSGKTNLVGVRIRGEPNWKLYRYGPNPLLRNSAYIESERKAVLWTRGWTPRLQTYPGLEVPNALNIEINRGKADIRVVLSDILGLTKLNFNSCIFADGNPITLKFADAIGEVLTAGPVKDVPPLPFRFYI